MEKTWTKERKNLSGRKGRVKTRGEERGAIHPSFGEVRGKGSMGWREGKSQKFVRVTDLKKERGRKGVSKKWGRLFNQLWGGGGGGWGGGGGGLCYENRRGGTQNSLQRKGHHFLSHEGGGRGSSYRKGNIFTSIEETVGKKIMQMKIFEKGKGREEINLSHGIIKGGKSLQISDQKREVEFEDKR